MDNSVTKEQVEEAFDSVGSLMSISDNIRLWRRIREHLIEMLFPPPFKPKRGQVIAVKRTEGGEWYKRDFIRQTESCYECENGSGLNDNTTVLWPFARPLNPAEINGESDD